MHIPAKLSGRLGDLWTATILGEPASKANSRQLGKTWKGKPIIRKSAKALSYREFALYQIARPKEPFTEEVTLFATIYYRTQRPDLDESLIMDILQEAGVVKNDRLIREKHIYHAIDKDNPRADLFVVPRRLKYDPRIGKEETGE